MNVDVSWKWVADNSQETVKIVLQKAPLAFLSLLVLDQAMEPEEKKSLIDKVIRSLSKKDLADAKVVEVFIKTLGNYPLSDLLELYNKNKNTNSTFALSLIAYIQKSDHILHADFFTCFEEAVHQNRIDLALKWIDLIYAKEGIDFPTCLKDGTLIHFCCKVNNRILVAALIEKGANAFKENAKGKMPIDIAYKNKNKEILSLLIAQENGWKDSYGNPLSHYCYNAGYYNLIPAVIKKIGVNAIDEEGKTLLHLASIDGNVKVISLLLKSKANLEAKDFTGYTPIMVSGTSSVMLKLIELGAQLEERTADGHNLFHHIFANPGLNEVIAILFEKCSNAKQLIYESGDFGEGDELTPLQIAIVSSNIDAIKICHAAGVFAGTTIDGKEDSESLLSYACGGGNVEVVSLLLKLGAKGKISPLSLQLLMEEKNGKKIAKMVSSNGIAIDSDCLFSYQKDLKQTLIQELILAKNVEALKVCHALGISLNTTVDGKEGSESLLSYACRVSDIKVISTLLKFGVTGEILPSTLQELAQRKEGKEIIEVLLRHRISFDSSLLFSEICQREGNMNLALHLLEQNPLFPISLNVFLQLLPDHELLILHKANLIVEKLCEKDHPVISQWIEIERVKWERCLQMSLSEKESDTTDYSALHRCSAAEFTSLVQRLIGIEEIDLNFQDINYGTPLFIVCSGTSNEEILSLLLKGGANPHIKSNGRSPLFQAIHTNSINLANKLIEFDPTILKDETKQTFFEALATGSEELIIKLIEHNFYFNLPSQDYLSSYTPLLTWLCEKNFTATTKALIQRGAGTEIINDWEMRNFYNYYDLLHPLLCQLFEEFSSVHSELIQAENPLDFQEILLKKVKDLVDPTKNAEGTNPLKIAVVLNSPKLFHAILQELSPRQYEIFSSSFQKEQLENLKYRINPTHFFKGIVPITIPPSDFDIKQILRLFDEIKFDEVSKGQPGYRDPKKLTRDDNLIPPHELREKLDKQLTRIQERHTEKEGYEGTPDKGTPEFDQYYDDFKNLFGNIGEKICQIEDLDERATQLIDLAFIGGYCGGKISEVFSLYKTMLGIVEEALTPKLLHALSDLRTGILKEQARDGIGTSYEIHRYNQRVYLLGEDLNLEEKNVLHFPDPFLSPSDHTASLAEQKLQVRDEFDTIYTPSRLIDFASQFLQESFLKSNDAKNIPTEFSEIFNWFKDNVPVTWKQKRYNAILEKAKKLEAEKMERKEIRQELFKEYGIYLIPDQSAEEAICSEQEKDYKLHYKVPKLEEWKPEVYNPLIEKVQEFHTHEAAQNYLKEHGIKIGNKSALEAIDYHRQNDLQDAFILIKDWRKKYYQEILNHANQIKTRKELEAYLTEKGIPFIPIRAFENLIEEIRAADYLEKVILFDKNTGLPIGIKRKAIVYMLKKMEILN